MYVKSLKRLFDFVGAAVLLVTLAPLMVGVAVVVWLVQGRPVLFRDERAGLNGERIGVTKFRSMRSPSETPAGSCTDEERLTPLGRFLRRTSLDELPQLFSVIRGDMSLVGPRPLPMRYVSRYNSRQSMRLLVRPGLTGWAQIHGRNELDWPQRFEYDAEYVEFMTRWWAPLLDIWIVVATARTCRSEVPLAMMK